jgi:hypothetical protein
MRTWGVVHFPFIRDRRGKKDGSLEPGDGMCYFFKVISARNHGTQSEDGGCRVIDQDGMSR